MIGFEMTFGKNSFLFLFILFILSCGCENFGLPLWNKDDWTILIYAEVDFWSLEDFV